MTTTPDPDQHIVLAALGGRSTKALLGFTAVSAPLPYPAALDLWARKQRAASGVAGLGRTHVLEYLVRSVADPRFAPLIGSGYPSKLAATKAWAAMYGYLGKTGGWIYRPNGDAVCQGWASLADTLTRPVAPKIAQGADGQWYVLDRELVS